MIKVVHFSITPLAGAPIRLVQALNRLTSIEARLIDGHRHGLYDHDIVFSESPAKAQRLTDEADIIHLHNYLDCRSTQFRPIDFNQLLKSDKRIIRHFHSTSAWIAEQMEIPEDALLGCTLPSLVIAQYPERFFIKSRVVPNLIPHSDDLYRPLSDDEAYEVDIFFSPTKTVGAFERRWDTKAAPETTELIRRISRRTGCTYKIMSGRPLQQALEMKRRSRIVVDDLVTGSYHLTGLEGLAQGKAVLSFLDERSLRLLRYISGSDHCPFINVRLEDAEEVLNWLLEHPEECKKIGNASHSWIMNYWNEEKLIQHFVKAYTDLQENSSRLHHRQNIHPKTDCHDFYNLTLPDLIFQARKNHHG